MKLLHAFALAATVALGANTAHAAAASPVDPPMPTLIKPGQTQTPAVYAARRAALMKAMGDGVVSSAG
jgi:hypothetical protein